MKDFLFYGSDANFVNEYVNEKCYFRFRYFVPEIVIVFDRVNRNSVG